MKNKLNLTARKLNSFNLQEMLVVLVIIDILIRIIRNFSTVLIGEKVAVNNEL